MNNYIVNIFERETKTAGSKAKEDIVKILTNENFSSIDIEIPKIKLLRVIRGNRSWKELKGKLQTGDTVIYQYPAISRIVGDYFLKNTNSIDLNRIIFIHDVESLRYYSDSPKDINRELRFINSFDTVIAHNEIMKSWLEKKGVTKKIISLEIFDYLNESDVQKSIINPSVDDRILFAGNLVKSKFLENLKIKHKLTLFGINPADSYPPNIEYLGSYSPKELESKMQGKYGLVWDGDNLDDCSGILGNYMKYNNPHKTSLYLSLGLPVIIWNKAALANFVKKNNVGIVIESLKDLDGILESITDNEYLVMKNNAIEISNRISSGFYTKKAINKAILK